MQNTKLYNNLSYLFKEICLLDFYYRWNIKHQQNEPIEDISVLSKSDLADINFVNVLYVLEESKI